ncbi:DUF3575 domain-containing protein [Flavobacterium cellulosilyticum]|uniref:DUF3575 domain-containing protein n=1 Tax=Flavobacterium cellulosilyticum TaxID=2541731 RepID=A0A4R5CEH5_9FLAO|nr:DUF3575 domain-containing protein [Flavobacterium cellulosilyticum]TDD97985.1 DUF3575 domain-containing protein [Flavobacterium cellulosilyticum]
MKKPLIIFFLLLSIFSQSQTYIKVNAFTTLLTIPNVGLETSIGKKSTLQFDVLTSFWKDLQGVPMEFYSFTSEYRYHFHENYNGFYLGGHIGFSSFNLQKWQYIHSNYAEKGIGYFMGATIGFQKKINNRFMLDCFVGGGSHQAFYKGYAISTGERVDKAEHYNKSGEWLPYRGGVMVSYRIN